MPVTPLRPSRPLAPSLSPARPLVPAVAPGRVLSPAKPATPRYAGIQLQDLSGALAWRPGSSAISGTAANVVVTNTYDQLDHAMTNYLGQPTIANWLTFGKYASANAGAQIRQAEDVLSLLHGSPSGLVHLWTDGHGLSDLGEALGFFKVVGAQFEQQLKQSGQIWNPFAQLGLIGKMKDAITTLRDAFTQGNTGVYADIVPAFDAYLKAEGSGANGVDALKKLGYGAAPRDPGGLILQGFQAYRAAKAAGDAAAKPGVTASQKQALLARRQTLVNRANLCLVAHEQWTVVGSPKVFGDPAVAAVLDKMGSQLVVKDATGTHQLLPHGGAWSDFATRMGWQEVPLGTRPDAIAVVDAKGQQHAYVVATGAKYDGTISAYFADNLTPAKSQAMIAGSPWTAVGLAA